MQRGLVKLKIVKPPSGLAHLFADPPVGRTEKLEDYENLFAEIASAAKPADAISWMYVRDITDLSWEIRREKSAKLNAIKRAEKSVVANLLTPPRRRLGVLTDFSLPEDPEDAQARSEAIQWAHGDKKIHRKVEQKLSEIGEDVSYILYTALERIRSSIDAIDERMATYELRRMATLREIERWNAVLERRLKAVSSDVIDGEFTEAAE